MCKKPWFKGKRLAHIFDDGWYGGSFKRKFLGETASENWGGNADRWIFYYNEFKLEYGHVLLIEEYGLTRSWVAIEKCK